ncbi:MAG TPA: YciI family protein [Pyrinomonadaceae bacterium]|nr:YciI family protein [Pyrinomonadaceae bacterium]
MLYALLIYENPSAFERRESLVESDAYAGAWRAYHRAMLDAGIFVGGKPLDTPETGTTVRLRDNKRQIQDGPYANTKEQLGGFTLLELPSLDAALEWAARCPAASYGAVEVRPIAVELEPRVTVEDTK